MTHELTPAATAPLAFLLPFDSSILAGQLAPSSIAMYTRYFRAYLKFAGSATEDLTPATLARWRTHLANETELSPNTINQMLSAVKRLICEAGAGVRHL